MNPKLILFVAFIVSLLYSQTNYAQDYITITTVAGTGKAQESTGELNTPSFNNPTGCVMDDAGNLFISDTENHQIRKVSVDGYVSVFAGSSAGKKGFLDGDCGTALFNFPADLGIDALGQLYIWDEDNGKIRKISKDGRVTTLLIHNSGVEDFAVSPEGRVCFKSYSNVYMIQPNGKLDTLQIPEEFAIDELANDGEIFYGVKKLHLKPKIQILQIYPTFKVLVDSLKYADQTYIGIDTAFTTAFKVSPSKEILLYISQIGKISEPNKWKHTDRCYHFNDKGEGVFVWDDTANYFKNPYPILKISKYNCKRIFFNSEKKDTFLFHKKMNDLATLVNDSAWIGAANGYLPTDRKKLGFQNLQNIFHTSSGDLLVCESGKDIKIISQKNNTVTDMGIPKWLISGIVVGDMCEDKMGNIYISLGREGIYRFCPKDPKRSDFLLKSNNGNFYGLAIDSKGFLFASDIQTNKIWKIDTLGKMGVFVNASSEAFGNRNDVDSEVMIEEPQDLEIDTLDNLYVWDGDVDYIKKISPKGEISAFAGNSYEEIGIEGYALDLSLGWFIDILRIKFDSKGNLYLLAFDEDCVLRKISPKGWLSTVVINSSNAQTLFKIAGGGLVGADEFMFNAFTIDAEDNIYLTDEKTQSIYKLTFPK